MLNLILSIINIGKSYNIIVLLSRYVISKISKCEGKQATKNHLFAAILGFVQLQRLTTIQAIKDCYQVRRELFTNVVKSFISECAFVTNNLNPLFTPVVNALLVPNTKHQVTHEFCMTSQTNHSSL